MSVFFSTETETQVIGAMLISSDAVSVAAEVLRGEDFYTQTYKGIFTAMVEIMVSGKTVDLLTVRDAMGKAYPERELLEVSGQVVAADNILEHCRIVKGMSTRRKLTAGIIGIRKNCESEDVETDRKSTRLNSSHIQKSRMPSSA